MSAARWRLGRPKAWQAAALVACSALTAVAFVVLAPGWFISWPFIVKGARSLVSAHWLDLYGRHPDLQMGPLTFALFAPIVLLLPLVARHVVASVVMLLCGLVAVHELGRLVSPDDVGRRRRWFIGGLVVLAALERARGPVRPRRRRARAALDRARHRLAPAFPSAPRGHRDRARRRFEAVGAPVRGAPRPRGASEAAARDRRRRRGDPRRVGAVRRRIRRHAGGAALPDPHRARLDPAAPRHPARHAAVVPPRPADRRRGAAPARDPAVALAGRDPRRRRCADAARSGGEAVLRRGAAARRPAVRPRGGGADRDDRRTPRGRAALAAAHRGPDGPGCAANRRPGGPPGRRGS